MLKKIKQFWDSLKSSKKILIINHIRMDMDAFWSMIAMYEITKSLWKEVKAINDEPPLKKYSFLWYNHIIEPDLDVKKYNPDLIICLDTANLDRLWNSYSNNIDVFNKANFIVIDHHVTNPWFGDLNIITSSHSSACEFIYEIFIQLWFQNFISPSVATAILTWIYTDTNVLYNSNTTSNTYLVISELLKYWADFRKPYYELYKKKTLAQTKLWWEILTNHMKIDKNWKLAWAMVPLSVFKKTWSQDRDLEWLISEFFANIDWVEVCFISHEIDDNSIKTSFRSTKNYDVSELSVKLWWWWHKQASWYPSTKCLQDVEKEILDLIDKDFVF